MMRKSLILLSLLCIGLFIMAESLPAQPFLKVKRLDFMKEPQGFDQAWSHIRAGDKWFREGIGTFDLAIRHYLQAKSYNEFDPALNFKLGVAYLYSDKPRESLRYFQIASEFDEELTPELPLMMARAYHYNLMFDEAINGYRTYLDSLSEKERKRLDVDVEKWIQECRHGKELVQDTLRVEITNLGGNINSSYDDYNPVLSSTGARMYFTSRRPFAGHDRRHPLDNKYYEDIYYSYYNGASWEKAEDLGKPVNSKGNESALYLTPDNQELYLYIGKKKRGNLYSSLYVKNKWQSPRRLSGVFNTRYKETSLSFNRGMTELFFVSDFPKESCGGKDIFYSRLDEKGKWTDPVNLGPVVNTPWDEEGVHATPSGDTLYFSSKGHNTMGGYDVFMTVRGENGEWAPPVNLGYPINTPGDEVFYRTTPDTAIAHYSATLESTLGWKDIYRIRYLPPPEPEPEVVEEPEPQPKVDTVVMVIKDTVRIVEQVAPPVDTTFRLLGTVLEEGTTNAVAAKIDLIDLDRNQVIATTISNPRTGSFRFTLAERKSYGVEITSEGYMLYLDVIGLPKDPDEKEMIKNFFLKKVKVGETVILKNIFFEFNSAKLTSESYPELNRVFRLLTTNPTIRIEVSGHTDNVGSLESNTRLSEARAKAVVDYLITSGIDPSRLEYKGYAFTRPIASNETEEGRARNRRVEFEILSK